MENLSSMGHGLYNAWAHYCFPMIHGLYDSFSSHGSWVVQWFLGHGSCIVQCCTIHGPWGTCTLQAMGCTISGVCYGFPMTHGLYNMFFGHGLWIVQHCTIHGSWRINYPWAMGCTTLYSIAWPMRHGNQVTHGPWTVQHTFEVHFPHNP